MALKIEILSTVLDGTVAAHVPYADFVAGASPAYPARIFWDVPGEYLPAPNDITLLSSNIKVGLTENDCLAATPGDSLANNNDITYEGQIVYFAFVREQNSLRIELTDSVALTEKAAEISIEGYGFGVGDTQSEGLGSAAQLAIGAGSGDTTSEGIGAAYDREVGAGDGETYSEGLGLGSEHTVLVVSGSGVGENESEGTGLATEISPGAGVGDTNSEGVGVGGALLLAPTNLTLTPGDTTIDASWDAVSGATGYKVRIASGSWVDKGTTRTHQFTGLTNGTQYTVEARAYDANGDGQVASAQATPEAAPSTPAYRSYSSNRAAANSVTVNKPVGTVVGDVLLMTGFALRASIGTQISAPEGWTRLDSRGTTNRHEWWWKRAGADEPSSYTFTASNTATEMHCVIVCYSGCVASGNPYEAFSVVQNVSALDAVVALPSIATADGGVAVALYQRKHTAGAVITLPTGYTSRYNAEGLLASVYYREVGCDIATDGTATGVATFTAAANGGARGGLLISLKPRV